MSGTPNIDLGWQEPVAVAAADRPTSERGHERSPAPNVPPTQHHAGSRLLDPSALGDHVDRLYRAARAMCASREEAEDLVQDTFALVLQKPRWLHSEDDVGYLLGVLKNTFVSGRRRAGRRPQASASLDDVAWVEDSSSPRPEARLDFAALYEAIGSLPDAFRDALVAVDVMGLTYREASRALRVREATITTRLHRGRQRVADVLVRGDCIAPAGRPGVSPVSPVACG